MNKNLLALAVIVAIIGLRFFQEAEEGGNQGHTTANDGSSVSACDVQGRVNRVVDGDSLYIDGNSTQIRLWAVDAPERDESGYDAARQELGRLTMGKRIQCARKDTDKYGRLVGQCFDQAGQDINKAMIVSGLTQEYCRFSKNHYNTCH